MMQVTGAAFQVQVNPLIQATDPTSHTPVYDDTTREEGCSSPTNPMIDPVFLRKVRDRIIISLTSNQNIDT
jgi:hypothetical protein